jgi:RNA recognition motif-containing protein
MLIFVQLTEALFELRYTMGVQSFWNSQNMSIYVGNLSYEVTQEDLTTTFAEYGSVKRVQLPTDRETGRMRGFAFVEMGSDAEEEKAITELDGAEWMGRSLKVNKAKPREDNRGGGGSFGGGGGGGGRRY